MGYSVMLVPCLLALALLAAPALADRYISTGDELLNDDVTTCNQGWCPRSPGDDEREQEVRPESARLRPEPLRPLNVGTLREFDVFKDDWALYQEQMDMFFLANAIEDNRKRRRQIFREQVLPHSGGKIPEDAFRSDRLALNRLNKEGISIPDGILLETRHRESHFPSHRHDPDIDAAIIKLVQRPDGRYAPPEGRYPFNTLVESTYVIRPPINIHGWGGIPPRKPVEVSLQLPAKPFFAEDGDALDSNIDLLNTINHEFPGTRLWTGFGPLFHETANRILRHSGSKKLENKPSEGNDLYPAGASPKQTAKPNAQILSLTGSKTTSPSSRPQAVNLLRNADSTGALTSLQAHQTNLSQSQRPGITNIISAAAMAQLNAAVKDWDAGKPGQTRALKVVDGVVTRVEGKPGRGVQALRPGPLRGLRTHLTAPPPGYPALDGIPKTSFACRTAVRQMESDPQTNCQFGKFFPEAKSIGPEPRSKNIMKNKILSLLESAYAIPVLTGIQRHYWDIQESSGIQWQLFMLGKVFHLCHPDGRKESFLCPAGSRYDAKSNLCSPWTNVPCPGDI